MGKNPVVAVVAVIILIVAIVLIAKSMSGGAGGVPGGAGDVFWYDTGSKTLYGAPQDDLPPIKAPSGSDGVIAHVFAKGSCDNASDRFIVYLQKFPNKEAILNANSIETRGPLLAAMLIRRENDADWVEAGSEEGAAIFAEAVAAGTGGVACTEYRK